MLGSKLLRQDGLMAESNVPQPNQRRVDEIVYGAIEEVVGFNLSEEDEPQTCTCSHGLLVVCTKLHGLFSSPCIPIVCVSTSYQAGGWVKSAKRDKMCSEFLCVCQEARS